MRPSRSWLVAAALAACAPAAPTARRPAPAEPPETTTSADAGVPKTPVVFDATLAKKRLDAIDLSPCRALPPFVDESLQVHVTFSPSGDATDVKVSEPFAATPFGDCVEGKYRWTHIAAFDPPAQSITLSLTRGTVKRDPTLTRFDPSSIRSAMEKANLAECGDPDTRREVIVLVKPSGQVESMTVEGNDARAKCIERVLRRIEFRPYSGAPGPAVIVGID